MEKFCAKRSEKSALLHLNAPGDRVFPLLCPTREYEWVDGWKCDLIWSESGFAEPHCVFTTDFEREDAPEVWVVCRYEPGEGLSFIHTAPGFKTGRLDLSLEDGPDNTCRLQWTWAYTGLSRDGNDWIDNWTDDVFQTEVSIIEKELNHYLTTGAMLTGLRKG